MTRIVFMGTPDFSVPVLRTLIEDGYEVVGVVTRLTARKAEKIMTPLLLRLKLNVTAFPCFSPKK
ncbi:hypothetical protein QNN00_20090 [Bacillus velezensis]|nr:hypothetical protein [Bacillus velezensis]